MNPIAYRIRQLCEQIARGLKRTRARRTMRGGDHASCAFVAHAIVHHGELFRRALKRPHEVSDRAHSIVGMVNSIVRRIRVLPRAWAMPVALPATLKIAAEVLAEMLNSIARRIQLARGSA